MYKYERDVFDAIVSTQNKTIHYTGLGSCRKVVDMLLSLAGVNKLSQINYVFNLTRERRLVPYAFLYKACKYNELNDRYAIVIEKDDRYYVAEVGGHQSAIIYTVRKPKSKSQ